RAGFELKGIAFDTMVASYLLNPGSRQHSLAAAAFTEFGYEMTAIESLLGPKGKDQLNMSQVAVARVADYSCEDADYTWRLYEKLKKQLLKNDLLDLLEDIENPLIRVLAKMEKNGVMIDVNFLKKMSRELALKINSLEAKIFKMAGMKFNVRSPLQLKEILFDKLNISTAGLARTKTGISTAAVELDKLQGRHPLIDLIREHRELAKLKSTYTDALPQLINPADKRIHTSFNQTVTATGRLSSSDPNLQNIPIRTELGRKIRQAFVAPVGYKIAALDYSQIELRIAAALSGDKKMIAAFGRKEDFHARTAAEVFEVSLDKVTSEMRRKAKEVNFGILYGLGAHGLAQRTGVSYEEALAFIEKYFDVYSDLKEYLEETITLAHSQEYVETLFGRKRYLPEINADHQGLRAQAERMALNHPFQGSSADLIKMAMIEVDKLIEKEFSADAVRMILQVHDELVFEIKDGLVKKASELIKDEMETVYKLKVPIVVDVGIGKNWGECK
ncbi:DNA polymerase I, partial [Candidatus Kuenenbacteria bacterium CG10_big_fil_rev_8_21_14_0_10_39_14]